MAKIKNVNYNPDVLNCLANLSNDEVFTPPEVVNKMLDLLPPELWKNKNIKFLDPCCKTGVFLREITLRLRDGLQDEIPDLQERINHILTNQVFGIAITELTSLISRRSVYCSKNANSKYSISTSFTTEEGNIYFKRANHIWHKNNCKICGAVKKIHNRDSEFESHAYPFTHLSLEEMMSMKLEFDVIIGNPPYQLSDGEGGNGSSAIPLYNKFIEKAKDMNPKYISMIIPARWYSGGKGLDKFRSEMLSDNKIKVLVDYPVSKDCFPGVEIKGGVCYFLWDKQYDGPCTVKNIRDNKESVVERYLVENNNGIFIRYNEAISIYRKVYSKREATFDSIVKARKPFGLTSSYKGEEKSVINNIKVYITKGEAYTNIDLIKTNKELVNNYKVYITKAYGAGENFPHQILNKPFIGEPNTCCTETYLVIGPFSSRIESENVKKYIETKFFRFMVLLIKNTQNTSQKTYSLVPIQDFSKEWTDEKLYEKYNLAPKEIEFIESTIKPMGVKEL